MDELKRSTPTRSSSFYGIIMLLTVLVSSPAHADVFNGSFESGTFAGWSTIGDTSIQTLSVGISPTDGQFMALLSTLAPAELPFSSNNAVGGPTVAFEFFGFTLAEINSFIPREMGGQTPGFPLRNFPAGDGSGIKQTITGSAGDILSFDFYYVTIEGSLNVDQAYVALIPIGGGPKTLMFLNPLEGRGTPSPIDLCHRSLAPADQHLCTDPNTGFKSTTTDWQHVTLALPSTGTFEMGFGMWEAADPTLASALFIDDVHLTSVPAPSTLVLLGVGLAGLIFCRRRWLG